MKEECECGAISSHIVFEKGETKRLCCKCYVQAGNIPADWHIECMREAGQEKEAVVWHGEMSTKRSSLV